MRSGEDEERRRGRAVAVRRRGCAKPEAGDGLLALVQHAQLAEAEHGRRRRGGGRFEELVDMPERDNGAVCEAEYDVREVWAEADRGDGVRSGRVLDARRAQEWRRWGGRCRRRAAEVPHLEHRKR